MRNLVIFCLALTFCVVQSKKKEDYYQLLGVKKTADKNEIKKAFKKLSLKLHPDKNQQNKQQAQDKFTEVVNAYETLKDDEKRQIYDSHGEDGVKQHAQGNDPRNRGGGGGGFGGGFDDFFGGNEQHFNFGGGGGGNHWHQQEEEAKKQEHFKNSDVLDLDLAMLSKFYRREHVWIVLLYNEDVKGLDNLLKVWIEMAQKFYGIFQVAAVDCDWEEELCEEEFNVRRYPEIQVFKSNFDSKAYIYKGSLVAEKIAGYAVQFMDSFVSYVSPQNYLDFKKKDSEKSKVILFTAKKSTPPLLKALSKEFKGKLVFGEVRQADPEFLKKFGITKIPTLRVLSKHDDYSGDDYEGEYKKDQLMKFLREYAYNIKKENAVRKFQTLTMEKIKNGHLGPNQSELSLLIITNEDLLKHHMQSKIFPNLPKQFKDFPVNFYQMDMDECNWHLAIDLQETGILLIKPKRQRYIEYKGDMDVNKIADWVFDVMSGNGKFEKMVMSLAESLEVESEEERKEEL